MSIPIQPALEAKLRERAEAEGLSTEAYVERLVRSDEQAHEELEELALEGLNSGDPIEINLSYWKEKHRRLEDRLKKTGTR
jgi:hypothetical protein